MGTMLKIVDRSFKAHAIHIVRLERMNTHTRAGKNILALEFTGAANALIQKPTLGQLFGIIDVA